MKKSRKEFIKRAHSAACSQWKAEIENEYPKLFVKEELVVGRWYWVDMGHSKPMLAVWNSKYGNDVSYGFTTRGEWGNLGLYDYFKYTPATDKEVETVLIKEAKRRGFKEGVSVDGLMTYSGKISGKNPLNENKFYYYNKGTGKLFVNRNNTSNICIFDNGKWATIIETITKEQAEKELGKTII